MTGGDAAIAALSLSVTDGGATLVSPGESLAAGGVQWYSFTVPTSPAPRPSLASVACRRPLSPGVNA